MSINKLSILGYFLFVASLIIFFWPKTEKIKNVVRIQTEIHRIQTIRKEQSTHTDTKIETIRKNAAARISNVKELDFNTEIVSSGGDSVCVEKSQLEKCIEYKIKFERDSSSLILMTADRDSCNSQLDTIVSKVDTIIIEAKKTETQQYKRGLLHGIISGVVATAAVVATIIFVTK